MQTPKITIEQAVLLLEQGEIVAFPTETVYGLGALASHSEAIAKIYQVKGRDPSKQLLLHAADLEAIEPFISMRPKFLDLLARAFLPGPLTLILPAHPTLPWATIGIRIPSHPIAQELLQALKEPLFATSANLSGRTSPKTAADVFYELNGAIAGIIDGGDATLGVASTILDLTRPSPFWVREGAIPKEIIRKILEAQ